NYGAYNFLFTANAIATFRKTQSIRKKIIKGMAANMARPVSQMIDLNGDPVEVSIRKTIEKNLTFENFNGAPEIELFNSLEGFTPEQWLNELPIKPVLYYTDVDTSGGGCRATFKPANRPPSNYAPFSAEQINIFLSQVEGPEPGHPDQLSLGFEKNPWVMIYAAVRARTKPRQIFWPFGSPVQFEAKAYAQPFGGRI